MGSSVGNEVGLLLVPRARSVVGPGALRAPRIVARVARPWSTASRLRQRGLLLAPQIEGGGGAMEVLYLRCAGLDVHKDSVVACVRCVSPPAHQEVRQFPTTTTGLLALGDWLASHGCTHVAMEATGVYW